MEYSDNLRDSLNEYHKNLIDVDSLRSDSSSELQSLRDENRDLREQIDQLTKLELKKNYESVSYSKQTIRNHRKKINSKQNNPIPEAPPINLVSLSNPFENYELNIEKMKIKPTERMPAFNWFPIKNVNGTVFETVNHNDKSILDKINFQDLERRFSTKSPVGSQRFKKMVDKSSSKHLFVEINRAKNIIIMKKRINLKTNEIREAIENFRIDLIPSEIAEILIKFSPSDQELAELSHSEVELSHYGEAEEFIYQVSSKCFF